jgi:hypothetical protein
VRSGRRVASGPSSTGSPPSPPSKKILGISSDVAVCSAPAIRRPPISAAVVSSIRQALTVFPRARSVRRSAPAKTSARRWVMRTTAAPESARFLRAAKRAAVSSGERTAVGSSRIRTPGSPARAPAISMRWRVPTGRVSTRSSGRPSSRPNAFASRATRPRRARALSKSGAFRSRRARLSATLAAPTRRSCCGTRAIPASRASRARRNAVGRPSRRISPESAASRPAAIETSVDLPAPFSPSSAWISPGRTERSASERACVEPNRFEMARSSRAGAVRSSLSARRARPSGSSLPRPSARRVPPAGGSPPGRLRTRRRRLRGRSAAACRRTSRP